MAQLRQLNDLHQASSLILCAGELLPTSPTHPEILLRVSAFGIIYQGIY